MKISAKRIACDTRISNIHIYTVSSISRFYDTTYYNVKRSNTFEIPLYDVLWVNISNLNALGKLHRSSSNSSSAWITRAYTLQPKSLKSITTRHDGTKRNTRNTTQNAIHANRDACKIDHDTSRFRGSRKATKPQSHEATKPQSNKATKPQSYKAAKAQNHKATKPQSHKAAKPQSRKAAKPQSHKARSHKAAAPLGSVVPMVPSVSVVLLGSFVSVGFRCSFRINRSQPVTTATQHNAIQQNTKTRGSAAEAVACK